MRHALHLLGSLQLQTVDGRAVERILAQPKLVGLLTYLAVPAPGRFRRRDDIVALFWPELGQERARAALRKGLHHLRAELGAEAIVARGDEEIAVSAAHLRCDAAEVIAATDSARLAEALETYAGELLPGFHLDGCADFERWLSDERETLRERAAAAAWALAQRYEGDDALSAAATWAKRSVRFSWTDERALRRALTMLERLGDRAGALRLYDEFARRLRDDLDAAPAPETRELAARLRADGPSGASA